MTNPLGYYCPPNGCTPNYADAPSLRSFLGFAFQQVDFDNLGFEGLRWGETFDARRHTQTLRRRVLDVVEKVARDHESIPRDDKTVQHRYREYFHGSQDDGSDVTLVFYLDFRCEDGGWCFGFGCVDDGEDEGWWLADNAFDDADLVDRVIREARQAIEVVD